MPYFQLVDHETPDVKDVHGEWTNALLRHRTKLPKTDTAGKWGWKRSGSPNCDTFHNAIDSIA